MESDPFDDLMDCSAGIRTSLMFSSDILMGARHGPALLHEYMTQGHLLSTLLVSAERESHPKQEGFSQHIKEKSELDFFRNLRVTKNTFAFLLNIVKAEYNPVHLGGRMPVDPEVCLQLGLWYLGNKATYREIAELFGLSEGKVHDCVKMIINIICSIMNDFIKWPTNAEAQAIERDFFKVAGFPGVIGAIDGCHIEIKAPDSTQADFIDRTNKHSVNLLAVCDYNKKFTYIDAGFPGSAHDSRVFRNSSLGQLMRNSPEQIFPSANYHIIGDSAFPLSPYLLVPFKDYGNLTHGRRKYNKKHSQTRGIIENAFGWLKGRFRRLKYIDAKEDRIANIIKACCILHNITLNDSNEEAFLRREGDFSVEIEDDDELARELPDIQGSNKRDYIASIL